MILGVDVSHFQGTIDWAKVAADGVAFAWSKATEGSTYLDPMMTRNVAGMNGAGIVAGVYHFLDSGSSAAQADWFCSHAPADVMHALDVEVGTLDVAGWVARYRQHYPTKTLPIYTGRDLWTRAGGGDGAGFGPLWVAGATPNAYLSGGPIKDVAARLGSARGGVPFGGWTSPTFVQFTDKAEVDGIAGHVDADAFFGSLNEMKALTTSEGDPSMEWTDKIKLTATDATWWNEWAGVATYKEGSEVSVGEMLRYPTLAKRIDIKINAQAAALAALGTQVAALTEAVAALSAADISGTFAAGVERLKGELAELRATITVGPAQ